MMQSMGGRDRDLLQGSESINDDGIRTARISTKHHYGGSGHGRTMGSFAASGSGHVARDTSHRTRDSNGGGACNSSKAGWNCLLQGAGSTGSACSNRERRVTGAHGYGPMGTNNNQSNGSLVRGATKSQAFMKAYYE